MSCYADRSLCMSDQHLVVLGLVFVQDQEVLMLDLVVGDFFWGMTWVFYMVMISTMWLKILYTSSTLHNASTGSTLQYRTAAPLCIHPKQSPQMSFRIVFY